MTDSFQFAQQQLMTHPDPLKRPSSTSIFYHPVLYSVESKTKAQLMHELQLQRQKNDILTKKLRENALLLKSYEMAGTPSKCILQLQKRGLADLCVNRFVTFPLHSDHYRCQEDLTCPAK